MSVGGVETEAPTAATPEVAEGEIIAAAEALLRERPFRELTVDEVMRRTDLSRPSFYVYFRDRHQLVLRVVEHLGSSCSRCPSAGARQRRGPGSSRARRSTGSSPCTPSTGR